MEENSDTHMETDVSSTTDDVLETPQVTGSHGDLEMVIVVEEIKEEEENSIDARSKRSTPSTSTEVSPKKQATPTKVIKPFENDNCNKKLTNNFSDLVKNTISDVSVKISPVNQEPESSSSPKLTEITPSPSKSGKIEKKSMQSLEKTVEQSPNKSPPVLNIKSPLKEVKLVSKPPIKLIRTHGKLQNNDKIVEKSPVKDGVQKPNKEASVVKISSQEIRLPEQSVVAVNSTEIIDHEKVSDSSSPNKVTSLGESSIKESLDKENLPNPSGQVDSVENANEETDIINQSSVPENNIPVEPVEKVAIEVVPASNNNNQISDSENVTKEINTVNGIEKMDISVPPDESLSELNGSQHSLDNESHNKSISRELKSLINSAKESKIISECNQLKSKTRKSRSQVDTSYVESEKVSNRRGSDNSQISNSSEKSEKTLKRSMRSQNPEFANKCKQFLSSLTSKSRKDSDEAMSEDDTNSTEKQNTKCDTPTSAKKKKKSDQPIQDVKGSERKFHADCYCWRCHWIVDQEANDKAHPPLLCTVCPRSFHYKCLSTNERKICPEKSWVCPECLLILYAEGSDTRSPAMKKTSLGTLCELFKYALSRMLETNGVEPFINAVDRSVFPDYDKYVIHPMDLSQMKQNIADGLYGSTEAFLSDAQWILHNSIIFNTLQSKLTGGARALLRSCRTEMGEIEACPECYAAAHARRATWFTDVCSTPHILLWAKLKGFPYWPAKGMSVNSTGMVDVRFFGAHDRAWVPAKDCFLFSEKDPNNFRSKRQDIIESMQEAEQYIRNLSRKYGKFVYPPFKTPFDSAKMSEQLRMMVPSFEGEITTVARDKPVAASPLGKVKRRSNSKGSKSSANDCDGSETEDGSSARTAASKTDKTPDENTSTEKPSKVDSPAETESTPSLEEPLVTRKRRRSNLEEASVLTVIETSQPGPEKRNKPDKPEQQEPSSSKEENAHSTTKETEPETSKKKNEPKAKSKDEEPSSTQEDKEALRVTPIKLVALPRTNKLTPKMFAATKAPSIPNSPKEDDKSIKTKKTDKDKTNTEKTKEDKKEAKKLKNSRSNKSLNSTNTPKSTKAEKKTENEAAKDAKAKDKNKDGDDGTQSAPEASKTDASKPDRLNFDDDTSLAVIARERRRSNANLPTITNVCSLSTLAQASITTPTPTTSTAQTEQTIQTSANSSVFTPTTTESVRNMKDAVTKLQKLRNNTEPVVGRVGVRAFARMTSPERADNVEVEIKAEPVDLEEDEVRLSEKMDLMTACKLQPVNTQSLRNVRITRVVSGPAKKPEPRPRARKTFPQPRPAEGRSELNGKNSMVYIPIQPPSTQPPVRPVRPTAPAIRINSPTAATSGNNKVNTVLTTFKPTSTQSSSMSVSTVGQVSLPNVGPVSVPTVGPTTVHTVPLMTSVNGQWMFSLQPVMSVGGIDNVTPTPLVNGTATPTIVPLPSTAPNATTQSNRPANESTPIELPRLQARPADAGPVRAPASAGLFSAKIHHNAQKLTDFFRSLIEDTIEKSDDPAASATTLRRQVEELRWRHSQEVEELKHNHELTLAEMRLTFEKEKLRGLTDAKQAAQRELEAAVKLAKSKQWCANCSQEAQFYCCWNTAYCDYPCQRAHWPQHFANCAQKPKDGSGDGSNTPESRLQVQPDVLPTLQKSVPPTSSLTVGGKIARVFSPQDPQHQKTSIIMSMVEDNSGNQTMKCVGTYKPGTGQSQVPSLLLNKQGFPDDAAKKVVTSGGYLIVGSGNNASVIAPAQARRPNSIQYFT